MLMTMITCCNSAIPTKYHEDDIVVYYDKIRVNLVVSHPSERKDVKFEIIRINPGQSISLWNCVVTAEDNQLSVEYRGKILNIDKEGNFYFRIHPDEGSYTFGNCYPLWEGKIHH